MPRSFIAELVVSHHDLPLTPTLSEIADVTVEVESQPLIFADADTGPAIFFSVRGTGFREFETALEADHTADRWQSVMTFEDCRVYRITLSPDAKFVTPEITDLGVHIISIRSAGRGWRFRLQASDKESLGAYWQYCRDEGVRFDLRQLYSTGPQATFADDRGFEAQLTDRQREVARTATRMGYYESDGASAEEVAAELGISPSTLSTHLRRIIGKLFEQTFAD